MKIAIKKAPPVNTPQRFTGIYCDNPECKMLPEHFIERKGYHGDKRLPIREGAIVAELDMNVGICGKGMGIPARVYYLCFDCIDLVFQDMRVALDKRLWAFH